MDVTTNKVTDTTETLVTNLAGGITPAFVSKLPFQKFMFPGMLAVSLFASLMLLKPFAISLCWAIVLSVGTGPIYRRMRVRMGPTFAAFLSCCLIFVTVLVPVAVITTEIAREAILLQRASTLPPATDAATESASAQSVNSAYRWALAQWKNIPIEWQPAVRSAAQQTGSFVASQSMMVLRNLVWIGLEAVVTMLTTFFLLRDSGQWWLVLRPYIPFSDNRTSAAIVRIKDLIYVGLFGLVVVAVVQGILDGVAFWIAGIPLPVLWGTALAVASMIPFVGAPVVWVPAALFLAMRGEYAPAIGVAVWALVLHGITDHVLRPLFVGTYTRTHLLLTSLGIMGGLMLMGPIGLFLGPVILVLSLTLLEIVPEELAPVTADAAPVLHNKSHETLRNELKRTARARIRIRKRRTRRIPVAMELDKS